MEFIENPEQKVVFPNEELRRCSNLTTLKEYEKMYDQSVAEPESFWNNVSQNFYWKSKAQKVLASNFDLNEGSISINWMQGAQTNICYNVLDKIIEEGKGERIAYHWEGNDGVTNTRISYNDLKIKVCKFANGLKNLFIKQGDRIAIYMAMSIDCVVAMLACTRIGAIHTVVFAGFSAEALAERIIDANCALLISSDGSYRENKFIPLKSIADSALNICRKRGYRKISNVVNKHLNQSSFKQCQTMVMNDKVDILWDDLIDNVDGNCEPAWINAEEPLFILYTSGSTGKPKGVVHTSGGYLLHSYLSFKYVFDYIDGDVFFSTADLGWMAAHTFNVYGSLANAASVVLLEGTPVYPSPARIWEIIDRLKVNAFYTAPTAIRTLMSFGDHYVNAFDRSSLKVLGTAGEPINPEAWLWYWKVVGNCRCAVVDTYWQTETGGPMITSFPGCTPMKPGSATLPFFGVVPAVLDDNGNEIEGPAEGHLVFKKPWPGIARTIDGKHKLFEMTYFNKFRGYYWTGDGVTRDKDGYYWITGRSDDTLNVSGHLLSTVEIETAILEHQAVSEAAAVSIPHSLKGEVLFVFIVLNNGNEFTQELELDIKRRARDKIGAHAQPEVIFPVSGLPKTKSGKIMRRILNKITRNDWVLGDTSTMADESILPELFNCPKK